MEERGSRPCLRKFASPLSHESTSSSESSRADRTRVSEFISRRKAVARPDPGEVKENQYPETEVSFSKDNFEADGTSHRRNSRSPSSSSSSDLQEVNAEIRRMLRGVLAQINPSTPTLHSGSYSANMILKKLKEKLEALERLGKGLDEHRKVLEAVERQTQSRAAAVKRLEDSMESKDRAHSEALRRIQSLEEALEEAQSARDQCGKERVEKMEEDLKAAALQLERRTYDLLQEERELESREAALQTRALSLSKLEKDLARRKASMDAREQVLVRSALCQSIVEEVVCAAEAQSLRSRSVRLIEDLQADLTTCRAVKERLETAGSIDEEKAELLRREQDLSHMEAETKERELRLSLQEAEFAKRLKVLEERENKSKQREDPSDSSDDKQDKAAKMWEAVLAKLEQVQKAEKRLETAKAEFLQQSQRIQDSQQREDERLVMWEETLQSIGSGDKDAEIRLLRSELRAKESLLQDKDCALEELHQSLQQTEAALEAKSREMEALVNGISKSLSPRKRPAGVSEEVQDFAQTYRQRQEALRRHIDAADDEKREMCQTLKGLLSDLT